MTPPREFVSALKAYDPLLRVRWGSRTDLWLIERKMPERHFQLLRERPNPFKSPRGLDLYEGWREGYVHVLSVHPSLLDNRVFETLRDHDLQVQGGIEKMNQRLDNLVAAERDVADRAILNFNESASREMFDRLQWGLGNRFAMGSPEVSTSGYRIRMKARGETEWHTTKL